MNFIKYKNILEFLPEKENCDIYEERLFLIVKNFIKSNNLKNILVSLSGGVDSMVLMNIVTKIEGINIICCHLNYNNRSESSEERDFLIEYCNYKNIKLEYINFEVKRNDINRNKYEILTKQLRYDFYKKLCNKYYLDGVFLGHHLDDYCENVFNNIMRGGKEITDLSVFKKDNILLGVRVLRPLLDEYKEDIYKFADKYNITYFLDTTPDWSCRGKMRREIFPKCEDCYSLNYKNNLIKIGKESEELSNIVNKYLIDKLFENVKFDGKSFEIQKDEILKEKYVTRLLLKKICTKLNIGLIKTKNIEILINNFDKKIKFNLLKDYTTIIDDNNIKFLQLST